MGEKIEIPRHADFMPIYGDLLGTPRATLFTSALRNRYAERGLRKYPAYFIQTQYESYPWSHSPVTLFRKEGGTRSTQ